MRAELAARTSQRTAGRNTGALFGSWLASALGLLGLLVPKCPLCLAAYLCVFGVSASSARSVAWLGVPLCAALIGASVIATAVLVAKRGRRSARQSGGACPGCAR
jgi:hypothetical protein